MGLTEGLKIEIRLCDENMTKSNSLAISIMENMLSQEIAKEYDLALKMISINELENARKILLKIKSGLERTDNNLTLLYVEVLYRLGIIAYNSWNGGLEVLEYSKTIRQTLEQLGESSKICTYDLGRLV